MMIMATLKGRRGKAQLPEDVQETSPFLFSETAVQGIPSLYLFMKVSFSPDMILVVDWA